MVTDAIITDIRENWQNEDLYKAKVTNWNYINCFMFAVFSSKPMDKIPYGNSEDEILYKIRAKSDFAEIGCLSGKFNPRDEDKGEKAFLADLKALGFNFKRVEENYKPKQAETKIAFMAIFGFETINFHMLREIDGKWYHKNGWWTLPSEVEQMTYEAMKKKCHMFMYLAIWRED